MSRGVLAYPPRLTAASPAPAVVDRPPLLRLGDVATAWPWPLRARAPRAPAARRAVSSVGGVVDRRLAEAMRESAWRRGETVGVFLAEAIRLRLERLAVEEIPDA